MESAQSSAGDVRRNPFDRIGHNESRAPPFAATTTLLERRTPAVTLTPLNTTTNNGVRFNVVTANEDASGDDDVENADAVDGPSRRSNAMKCINIGFAELSYTVRTWRYGKWHRENKTIIDSMHGEFRSGELTAIMGPSGAGKSTLMDILAGYTTTNVRGHVTINGRERVLKTFHRQAAYIMQDHNLQPFITVMEAMHFSANLKIGSEMSATQKKLRITQILDAIGLFESRHTRTGLLSGGQKKRLSIALEIVDNPPVMLFDEPTSGLDSSTSTQVVSLLQKLAQEGRTIICTIHQPSAIVMGMFDHLYAVAEGRCIYTGAPSALIPFLADLELVCPESYNPTDYLLEIATHDYGFQNDRLVEKTKNGAEQSHRKQITSQPSTAQALSIKHTDYITAAGLITPVTAPPLPTPHYYQPMTPLIENPALDTEIRPATVGIEYSPASKPHAHSDYSERKPMAKTLPPPIDSDDGHFCRNGDQYATSFGRQLSLLVVRTFLNMWRDRSLTAMRLFVHCCIALLIGTMYVGIGNDAANVFNIFRYVFFSIMFTMFTAFSAMTLVFPMELPIVTREHFNRWYSLQAYYAALSLADAPIQIACILIYTTITYLMTSQPLEAFRFGLFFGFILMTAFVAQSLGLLVGALFNVKNGAIFGPFFICPFLIFSGFFIHLTDAHPVMHWLFHISFLKYALEGASLALFGYDRPRMDCDQLFCQFVLPKKFMKTIDMHNGDIVTATVMLLLILLLFRCMAFAIMYGRLAAKR